MELLKYKTWASSIENKLQMSIPSQNHCNYNGKNWLKNADLCLFGSDEATPKILRIFSSSPCVMAFFALINLLTLFKPSCFWEQNTKYVFYRNDEKLNKYMSIYYQTLVKGTSPECGLLSNSNPSLEKVVLVSVVGDALLNGFIISVSTIDTKYNLMWFCNRSKIDKIVNHGNPNYTTWAIIAISSLCVTS